jgi:serine phosphatase RsbU (regulator of sigma subunit)
MAGCVVCEERRVTVAGDDLVKLHEAALPCPAQVAGPFELARWSRPAGAIGGDVLAAWSVDRDRLVIFLADVMGHNLASAMVAAALRLDLFRLRQAGLTSPAALLHRLDQGLAHLFPLYHATAACCLLDAREETLTWALAGHPPALLREPAGEVVLLGQSAFPLGLLNDEDYVEEVVGLPAGSTVLLYSDGVTDPLGGSTALGDVLAGEGDPLLLVDGVCQTVEPLPRSDDCSLLAVRVGAGPI